MSAFNPELTLSQKIMEWQANAQSAKHLKELEMAQRKELDELLFPSAKKGTNTHDLGNGYKLQAVHGTETKLDEASYKLIEPELSDEVKDACIVWSPKLVVKEYSKLASDKLELLDEAVVTKPKAITMKIVEPKAK